jgi:hypothetical protein
MPYPPTIADRFKSLRSPSSQAHLTFPRLKLANALAEPSVGKLEGAMSDDKPMQRLRSKSPVTIIADT